MSYINLHPGKLAFYSHRNSFPTSCRKLLDSRIARDFRCFCSSHFEQWRLKHCYKHFGKFTFWTQSHGGLVQMMFRISNRWFSGSKAVNFPNRQQLYWMKIAIQPLWFAIQPTICHPIFEWFATDFMILSGQIITTSNDPKAPIPCSWGSGKSPNISGTSRFVHRQLRYSPQGYRPKKK